MLCRNLIPLLAFMIGPFSANAQLSALDKAFRVPPNLQETKTQLDSLLAVGPLTGKAENERLCMISRLYRESDAVKALAFARNTVEKIEASGDSSILPRIYEIYGHSLAVQGDFPAAQRYFTKALIILEKQKDAYSQAAKYRLLAHTSKFVSPDEYITKTNYFKQCFELFKQVKDYEGMGEAVYSLGGDIFYKVTGNNPPSTLTERNDLLKEALEYDRMADDYWRKANLKDRRAAAIVSQGQIYELLGKPGAAKSLLRKAYLIHRNEKSPMGMQRCAWEMARILERQQQFDSAIFFIRQSAAILEKLNVNSDLADNYDLQTSLFKRMKNYPEALKTSEQARGYREKSFTVNHLNEVLTITNSYENQLKDERIKELEAEKRLQESIARQQRLIGLAAVSILTIIIGLGSYGYYQRQKSVDQMKENIRLGGLLQKNLEHQLQDTQLSALKAQMNPHFVGNAINAVQNLILQEKNEAALHYLNDFSRLTRHALENAKKETITLKEEVEFLGQYFRLEQLRYPDKFDFEVTIDPSIDDLSYERIPPMMIQPFVENAIRHGLHHKSERGHVSVSFKLANGELHCTIEDDGVGRTKAAEIGQQHRESHATAITDARLALLQKKADLQHQYKIQIEDLFDETGKAVGTKVVITFPSDRLSFVVGLN